MAGQGTNRWVVLLNRSPKGPLTEEEVKTLLERGILRANDIAYLVSEAEKGKSEWKLLWQFPEFNRRQARPEAVTEESPPPSGMRERRAPTPPEEIQKKAVSELPPDLMEISPEDLLPRSTQISFKPEPAQIAPTEDQTLLQEKPEGSGTSLPFDIRWLYGLGAALAVLIAVLQLPSLWLSKPAGKDTRSPTGRQNIDALQPMKGNEAPAAASENRARPKANFSVGVGSTPSRARPSIPQTRAPEPSAPIAKPFQPDAGESSLDTPPPPTEEEPIEEEASPPPTEEQSQVPPQKAKRFERRATPSEEDANGPAVETMPATPENESAPLEEGGDGPAD